GKGRLGGGRRRPGRPDVPRPLRGADEPGPALCPGAGSLPPAGPVRVQRIKALCRPYKTHSKKLPDVLASGSFRLVREKRVELSLFRNWCLKPARLPFRHSRMDTYLAYQSAGEMSIRNFDQNAPGAAKGRPGAACHKFVSMSCQRGLCRISASGPKKARPAVWSPCSQYMNQAVM